MDIGNGRKLYAHQVEAVHLMLNQSCVIAHDMGLGKTLAALVAAKHASDQGALVVVVAPINMHRDWRDEAARVGVPIRLMSWAKVEMDQLTPFVLIADEAHYAQSMKSQRTRKFLALAKKAQRVWCLTGTPMRGGRPSNLYPLLVAIGHPLAKNRNQYELRYCDAKATHFTRWDITGASNLTELHMRTNRSILRRQKEDCVDLPPKTRVMHDVPVTKDDRAKFIRAWEESYQKFLDGINEDIEANKHNLPDEAAVAAFRKERLRAKAAVQVSAARQASSLVKVAEAASMVRDLRDAGKRVVVFASFKASVRLLEDSLSDQRVGVYVGDMSKRERDEVYSAWKAGEIDIFIATPESGGVGLNLQEAADVILIDRPYTCGDLEQAEDRCHRIGTNWPVTAYWLRAFEIDAVVDEILLEKLENAGQVIDGGRVSEYEVLRRMVKGKKGK